MAEFIARLKPRKSSVSGEIPTSSDLEVAEIAVNTADGKLFVKHTDGTIKEISGAGGGVVSDGSVRTSAPQVTTAVLAQDAAEDVTFTQTGRSGQFLKVESSCAAWVVFYSSQAARTADAGRASTEDPAQGAGVLMEVFFDQAETALITPSVLYFNDNPNAGTEIYAKVVNRDATAQAVTITATVVPIEGRAVYEAEGTARIKGLSVVTASLAANAAEFLTLNQTARSGQFTKITTSAAARVIFYSTTAARTADSSRQQGQTPLASSGVLMEVITAGAETLEVTPAILYQNSEPNAAGELYMSVTNLETTATAITVTVDVVPIEGRGAYLSELHELLDVDTTGVADGDGIVYDAAASKWVPGATSGGSGGGGSSTVVAPFAFGHLNSTASGTGVGVSWGAYDAGTGNVSVTFDTAQADTSYIVVTDCESADDVGASVGSKSTTGFTLSFYDFSSGNPASPSVHPQTFQVFTSSGTQQVAGGGSGGGGAVDSVNSQTGVVSLGVQDMDDFDYKSAIPTTYTRSNITTTPGTDGEYYVNTTTKIIYLANLNDDGVDESADFALYFTVGGQFYWRAGTDLTWYNSEIVGISTTATRYQIEVADTPTPYSPAPLEFSFSDPTQTADLPLQEGDVLQWVNADQKFKPAQLSATVGSIDDLSDVSYSNGSLNITALDEIFFTSSDTPAGVQRKIFTNPTYGLGLQSWDSGALDYTRLYVHETNGFELRTHTGLTRLSGNETLQTNQPELRWESGDATSDTPTGNHIGLKLPAGISQDTTYTFPLAPSAGLYLKTAANGDLSWEQPGLNVGSPAVGINSGIALNYEEDGTDTTLNYANGPSAMSTDAQVGTKSIRFNVNQADGEYCQGVYPVSPFGDNNYLGTRAFTFQTWFKNLNPELPGSKARYHRMISGVGGTNQVNTFQIRTNGSTSGGVQGAWQLHHDAVIVSGSTAVTDANWHHLVVQHNGAGTYQMFLDGNLDGSAILASPVDFENGQGFILGGRGDFAANTFFQGNLDATELICGIELYNTTGFTPPTTPVGRTLVLQERSIIEIAETSDLGDVSSDVPNDNDVLQWDAASSQYKPVQLSTGGGGSTVSDLADLDDVTAVTPSDGEILYMDNGVYKHSLVSQFLSGRTTVIGAISTTVTSDTGLAGINGFYADTAAMEADGFTSVGGLDVDDQPISIPTADFADYSQIDYLSRGFSNLYFCKINSNGSVYLNDTSVNISTRTGDFVADHAAAELVVAWASEDTEVRRAGYKEITQDGTDWFVVRVDMKVPYNNDTGGYPLETWFGKDGRIRQYFGLKVGTGADLTLNKQGVAGSGTSIAEPTGLSASSGQRVEYVSAGTVFGFAGAKLEDLSDVGTPADGEVLTYDAATTSWVSTAPTASAPVDSVNGETGVVSLGIEDMDDFEKIALVSTSHRYTLMPDTDAAYPNVAAGQYAVASDGSWLRFNYEDADGNTVAFTSSADIWTTTNLAGSWTAGNANTTQDDPVGVRYFFRGAGAAIAADLGATTYLSVINPTATTYAPLADGDILQWVDADSKFKPAQLAAIPVDSVNGETGVVSLGIQDMDDYALHLAPPQGSIVRGPKSSFVTYINSEDGRWAWQSSTQQQISYFAQDGTDETSNLSTWAVGHEIVFRQNGVEIGRGELASFTIDTGSLQRVLWSLTNGQLLHPPSTTDDITITNETLLGGLATVALADGDILQWDDADSKFMPAQLPATPVDANSHTLPQLFGIGAHVSFDASAGGSFNFATDTIASGNVSGITRTATGKFTITFTNAFASNAYTAVCTAGDEDYSGTGASPRCVNVVSRSAGSMDIVVERSDDAVEDDEGYIAVMVIGLLA